MGFQSIATTHLKTTSCPEDKNRLNIEYSFDLKLYYYSKIVNLISNNSYSSPQTKAIKQLVFEWLSYGNKATEFSFPALLYAVIWAKSDIHSVLVMNPNV